MSISVILPAYEEEENLKVIIPKLNRVFMNLQDTFEILVVDRLIKNNNTRKLCNENGASYINREYGDNYGDAIRTGIKMAKYKWIVVMDADGSHNPEDIIRFYKYAKKGYDVIIGSRYMKGGNSHNNFILKMMSYVVNLIYKLVFNIKAHDISNSFRMYNSEKLKTLELNCINFDIVEEILILFGIEFPNYKLIEIPVFFNKRMYGKSKRDLFKFTISYISSISKMYKIKNITLLKQKKKIKGNQY